MEARRWLELREAADLLAHVSVARPLLVELLRPQTAFNHALLDLLERWPQVAASPTDLTAECARIETLAVAAVSVPRSHRPGLRGQLVTAAKRLVGPTLEVALRAWLDRQRQRNLARIDALRPPHPAPADLPPHSEGEWPIADAVRQNLLAPQARFEHLLDDALLEILRIDTYAAAYRAWVETVEPTLPIPPAPSVPFTVVCEGSPSPAALKALLAQKGNWDCVFTEGPVPRDRRFRLGTLDSVRSDFVLWVSEDVELAPNAVAHFAACTDVDLAYADEDDVGRINPFFKPSFCSELATERDLLGGAVWVRRTAMRGAGPLDWALALPRDRIRRIPAILTHRVRAAATQPRTKREVPADARVSIIVPFRDKPELLEQLLASTRRHSAGVPVEWIFVDNGSREPITGLPGMVLRAEGPFNWSRLNNLAARRATGTHLLFLNNDIEVGSDDWLKVLLEYACLPNVGVVGANLWYPDGTLQHSGVALGVKGLAGHVFARHREGRTPFGSPFHTRQVSAVTGACLLVKRDLFAKLGGFDEQLPISGGDVELCLRTGLRVLNVPHVQLIHHESLSRSGIALSADNIAREREAYAPHLPDPFYNPNLTQLFLSCAPNLEGSLDVTPHRPVPRPQS